MSGSDGDDWKLDPASAPTSSENEREGARHDVHHSEPPTGTSRHGRGDSILQSNVPPQLCRPLSFAMDDDALWMTATASRRKKHNPRANDDRRRPDRPERSRHTRSTKERPHDRGRHTDPIEKPLNYAQRHHPPHDRVDPGERVRDWVQRTQNRHSHRSLPTAPDSDEKLRRTSSPRYRSADIIRNKKRGRSVSRSPSVSLDHEPSDGRADTRFEKRRRHKTHEDKYEYKGDINRRNQPSRELRAEPKQRPSLRDVVNGRESARGPLHPINSDNRGLVSKHKAGRASKHIHAKHGREPRHSSSSSRFLEDCYGPSNRSPVLPSRPPRQYISTHPQDSHYESGQDDSYFTSSSRIDIVAQERRDQYPHFSRKPKDYEQAFANNGWAASNSMSHPGDSVNHIMPSVERPHAASPPTQLATPLARDRPKHGGTDAIPTHPQNIVTIVLPRYKDVETQTDPSLLGGLRGPIVEVAEALNRPVDIAKQAYYGAEIQRRIQLLPGSPYPDNKPPPLNEMNCEPPRQYHAAKHQEAQIYAVDQTPDRAQSLAEQRYPEESVPSPTVQMPSRRYSQAHATNYASGESQPRYLSQRHTLHSQPLNTNTFYDGKQIDRRLNDLIQQHEGRPPAIIVVGSQQLAQKLGQKVRFQDPRPTVPRPGGPYMEDVDDFISRIEEEDLRELGNTSAMEEIDIPVKTEEYDEFGELRYEQPDTVQDGESGQYEPTVRFDGPGRDWDTESFGDSRRDGVVTDDGLEWSKTPEMISRPPVTPRHIAQDGADISFTGRRSGARQVSVRPWRYGESYGI